MIQALTDGMREGSVRRDLPADDLAVPVMGTLQHMGFLTALAHREPQMPRPEPARVLTTLLSLLQPPAAPGLKQPEPSLFLTESP